MGLTESIHWVLTNSTPETMRFNSEALTKGASLLLCLRNHVHLQDCRSPSRSRSRSRSFSRSRSRSYSRSRSRSRLRSRSPRRFNRSVTPPPRRGFGLRADQQGRADGRRPGAAPVHGIPPPGSGPAPPAQPPQPYGVLPPVSAFPPSSGPFGQMAPNPLAGMFQPLPAAPPTNPMLVNQQVTDRQAHVCLQNKARKSSAAHSISAVGNPY